MKYYYLTRTTRLFTELRARNFIENSLFANTRVQFGESFIFLDENARTSFK